MGEIKERVKHLYNLKVYECDGCNGTATCINYPAGWFQEFQFVEEQDSEYPTGNWYCPHCRKEYGE